MAGWGINRGQERKEYHGMQNLSFCDLLFMPVARQIVVHCI